MNISENDLNRILEHNNVLKEENARLREAIGGFADELREAYGILSIYHMHHNPDPADNYYRKRVYEFVHKKENERRGIYD